MCVFLCVCVCVCVCVQRGTPLTEREAATVMRSVLEVIVTCHAHDHIHGDCKPANFLLLNPHRYTHTHTPPRRLPDTLVLPRHTAVLSYKERNSLVCVCVCVCVCVRVRVCRSTGCQEFPSTQQTPEPEGPATLSDYHAQHSGSSCDDIDPSAHACPIPIPTSPSPPPPPPQPGRSHTPQPASDTTLQHLHASYQLPAAAGAGAADPSALAQPCDILTKSCGGSSDGGPGSTKTSTTASSSTAQDSSSGSTDSTTSSTAQDSSTSSTAQDSSSGSTDSGTGMSGGVSSTAAHGDSSTDNTSVSRRGGTAVNGVGSATAHGISGASTEPAVSGDSSRCTSAAGMSDESSSSDMPLLPDWLRVLTEAKYIPTQDLMAAYQAMASDDESVVGGVAGGVVGGVAGGQWFATCGWGCGEEMVVLATDFGCAQPLHPVHRKGVLRKRRIGSPVSGQWGGNTRVSSLHALEYTRSCTHTRHAIRNEYTHIGIRMVRAVYVCVCIKPMVDNARMHRAARESVCVCVCVCVCVHRYTWLQRCGRMVPMWVLQWMCGQRV